MLDKAKTIQELEQCVKVEETAIPLYSKHIKTTLFFSGFKEEDRDKIKEILERLKSDSEKHKVIFEGLLKKVTESGQSVY